MQIQVPVPPGRSWLGVLPILAGVLWLLSVNGVIWGALSLVPSAVLVAGGVCVLLLPGDARALGLIGMGGLLGVLMSPLAWLFTGLGTALLVLLLSLASLVVAGQLSLRNVARHADVPPPMATLPMSLKVALDEAVLGYFVSTAALPGQAKAVRMGDQARQLQALIDARQWARDPARLHVAPAAPAEFDLTPGRWARIEFQTLRFASGFSLPTDVPLGDDPLTSARNRMCHVRVLRHPGAPRPWLMCVHGYRMGSALTDFGLFDPRYFHHRLGLNVIQPVLPLHGPRRTGKRSGDFYLDGDLIDLFNVQTQALWDLRRTLAWLRAQEPEPVQVGVLGISLGGYNTALLAGFEADLDFAIAGIPVTDFAGALWRVLPPAHAAYFAQQGLDVAAYRALLAPVSPLSVAPLIPESARHIFAATEDRLVPAENPLALSAHWQVPVQWYQGAHLTIRNEPLLRRVLRQAAQQAGWNLP